MILNISKIKTQSLLLFCKDLILSYKDKVDTNSYEIDKDISKEFDDIGNDMLKHILNVTYPDNYYIENRKHFKAKAILDAYKFLNSEIEKNFTKNEPFNPSMLYFSLLAMWFKELNKESTSKEYIYFILYPYFQVYDRFLVNMKDAEFKKLNIKMIELAEKVIHNFDKYSFR